MVRRRPLGRQTRALREALGYNGVGRGRCVRPRCVDGQAARRGDVGSVAPPHARAAGHRRARCADRDSTAGRSVRGTGTKARQLSSGTDAGWRSAAGSRVLCRGGRTRCVRLEIPTVLGAELRRGSGGADASTRAELQFNHREYECSCCACPEVTQQPTLDSITAAV